MSRLETPHRTVRSIFANEFDRDASYTNWRPRGTNDWLLLYTVAGQGIIGGADGRERPLKPGEAVLFAPGCVQDYRTDEAIGRWRLYWAHFQPRPHWRAWTRWPAVARGSGWLTLDAGEARKRFEIALVRMVKQQRSPHGYADELALNALEEALLWAQQATGKSAAARLDERVRVAMDYLATHVHEPFRLDVLARHCGLSESRLSHLFKEETGETPQRYSEELRLGQAEQLLAHSSLRVHEIAAETGFADPFYFAKRFRKFSGRSPSEHRDRVAKPRTNF